MSDVFKEKWKVADGLVTIIDTVSGKLVGQIEALKVADGKATLEEKKELTRHVVDSHNACRNLARPDLVGELMDECEMIIYLENKVLGMKCASYHVVEKVESLMAQIRGKQCKSTNATNAAE